MNMHQIRGRHLIVKLAENGSECMHVKNEDCLKSMRKNKTIIIRVEFPMVISLDR